MLAIVVAVGIGYLPAEVVHQDPRAAKLRAQLDELDRQAAELRDANATLARQIRALGTDVRAIEDHARADLGMVYPDEIVVHVKGTP